MARKIFYLLSLIFLFGIVNSQQFSGPTSGSGFAGPTNNWQAYQPTISTLYSPSQISDFWPIMTKLQSDQCDAKSSDFIVGIPPGGCSPMVVRSDLLEDQNVPVFCKLYAVKINPLIKVSSIKSISFKGNYPKEVSRVSFYPARAAVRSYHSLLGDPMINNIGYVVIILKRNPNERNMSKEVFGNLTATIRYDAEEAFGVGQSQYFLPVLDENEWSSDYKSFSFWKGMGYLRAKEITSDGYVTLQVLKDKDSVVRTLRLKAGETSELIYLPGYYCGAALRVRVDELVRPSNYVLLNVDGNEIWAFEGSRFLNNQCVVKKISISEKDNSTSVTISCAGNPRINLNISRSQNELVDYNIEDANLKEAFELAKNTTFELIEDYPREMKEGDIDNYGEEALFELIQTSEKLSQFKTEVELIDKFISVYPNSKRVSYLVEKKNFLMNYDYSFAFTSIYVSNNFHYISLVDYRSYADSSGSVDLRIGNRAENAKKIGDVITLSAKGSEPEYLQVTDIRPTEVSLKYYKVVDGNEKSVKHYVLKSDKDSYSIEGREVSVRNIEINAHALVSLLPEIKRTSTEANFSFRIGIEKRAIKLSDEKTQEMIKNLENSIKKLEGIVDKLGKMISVWKGACFATGAVLSVKNMVSGMSGEAIARSKVMAKYREKCAKEYPALSRTECYNKLSKEIDADVKSMANAINSVNKKMDDAMAGNVKEGAIVNESLYIKRLKDQLGNWNFKVNIGGEEVEINANHLTSAEQFREAILLKELERAGGSGLAYQSQKELLETKFRNLAHMIKLENQKNEFAKKSGIEDPSTIISYFSDSTKTYQWRGQKDSSGRPIQDIMIDGNLYRFVLKDSSFNYFSVEEVLVMSDGSWKVLEDSRKVNKGEFVFLKSGTLGNCDNAWPKGTAKVIFYESGRVAKLPAIVPFDLKSGYYVKVDQEAYTDAGDVRYFEICNIGSNKIMESGFGDDLCQTFDVNTVDITVSRFTPCVSLDSSKVRELYSKAREAIRQASRQYGQRLIRIFDEVMETGDPAVISGVECQDFMSPDDCKTLFNVCDPVICPPSRCNFGGKIPVSDVIQTGVIGSLVLCLPNAKEGVMVPICVSGVRAGLEGYLSIMKARRDCLNASLANGQNIGICDQINSIYTCEFFWRQIGPVTNVIIPKLFEGLYGFGGQRVRGGGEYLTIQSAWENLQKSIDYFKNNYAQNAFRAFNLRSTEEVGSMFCKAFLGTSVPSSSKFLKSLLDPESPSQFYAQFSEIPFSSATVPATSQYKVYYHIYAGNDTGVYYRIYLKNPPQSSYYRTSPIINVKTGYIAKGQSVDESIDFTAPEGYKELCVVINSNEKCGFKQVTTEFGLDYLAKKYVEKQAENREIRSTKECLSGTPSELSLVNLNIQEGVNEMVNPKIAMRGIVRVCASENPGQGVSGKGYVSCESDKDCTTGFLCQKEGINKGFCAYGSSSYIERETRYSRWKDVGSCDGNMRCWLDTESVKDDLEVISAVENRSIRTLEEQMNLIESGSLTSEGVLNNIAVVRERMRSFSTDQLKNYKEGIVNDSIHKLNLIIGVSSFENPIPASGTNKDRAEALSLKATIYRMVVEAFFRKEAIKKVEPVAREEEKKESQNKSYVVENLPSKKNITEDSKEKASREDNKTWIVGFESGTKIGLNYSNRGYTQVYGIGGSSGYSLFMEVSGSRANKVGTINSQGIISIDSEFKSVIVPNANVLLSDLEDYVFNYTTKEFLKKNSKR